MGEGGLQILLLRRRGVQAPTRHWDGGRARMCRQGGRAVPQAPPRASKSEGGRRGPPCGGPQEESDETATDEGIHFLFHNHWIIFTQKKMAGVESEIETQNEPDSALQPNWRERPCMCLMIARPGSGKTTLIKAMIRATLSKPVWDYILVFSPTAHLSHDFDYLPKHAVRNFRSPKQIYAVVDKLTKAKAKGKPTPKLLMVLDDCASACRNGLIYDPAWQHFLNVMRHVGVWVIFTSQSYVGCSTQMRQAVDLCCTFRTSSQRALRGLWDIHRSACPTLESFVQAMREACDEKYSCLYFDSRTDEMRSFKADVPKPFKVDFPDIKL